MTIEYYNDREEIARAFDDAADAVREEKTAAGSESTGKYYHVKRQLRREIWAEEDNPPAPPGEWTLLRLFNAYAATVDANAAETDAGKRELFFYLRGFLIDKICERLGIDDDRVSANAAFDTLERMTERRRAAIRAKFKQEETE